MRKILKKVVVFMLVFSMAFSTLTVLANDAVSYARLKVNGGGFTVNGGVEQELYNYSQLHAVGTEITLNATDENFAYWMNDSNMIVGEEGNPEYTFTIAGPTTYTAVYYNSTADTIYAEFVSDTGQVVQAQNYNASSEIVIPSGPAKTGFDFVGWSMDADDIKGEIGKTNYVRVTPNYIKQAATFQLTVVYDKDGSNITRTKDVTGYSYASVGLTEDDGTTPIVAGKTFSYWADENGNVLGVDEILSVYASKSKTVYAVYDEELSVTDGAITITNVYSSYTESESQRRIHLESNRAVLDGYTVIKAGFLRTTTASVATDATFIVDGSGVSNAFYEDYPEATGYQLYAQKVGATSADTVLYFRAYMILQDSQGNQVTKYSSIWGKSYNTLAQEESDSTEEVAVVSETTEAPATVSSARLKVNGGNYTINGGAQQSLYNYSQLHAVGTEITLNATGENFAYWMNDSNMIVGTEGDPEYTFTIAGPSTYTAVYYNASADTVYAEFVSDTGQVVQAQNYGSSSEVVIPSGPAKTGFDFDGWSMDADGIKGEIGKTNYVRVTPNYTKQAATFQLTVVYDKDGSNITRTKDVTGYSYASVGLTEDDGTTPIVADKTFSYWADENGNVLGVDEVLTVYASKSKTVYAVYDEELSVADGAITITNVYSSYTESESQRRIHLESNRAVLDGYTVIKAGFLRTTTASVATDTAFVVDGSGVSNAFYEDYPEATGYQLYAQKVGATSADTVLYFRAYMILQDSAGNQVTRYSGIWGNSYNGLVEEEQTPDEPAVGTQSNPEVITEVNTSYAATITDGAYYYSYTATEAGTITVETYTEGASYAITNTTAGGEAVTEGEVSVNAGDVVEIAINGSAGTVDWYLMFTALPGTVANPIWLSVPTTVTDEIAPDASVYYQGRLGGMILTINDADASVIYNGTTYGADENGVVSIAFPAGGGMFAPADVIQVVNTGDVAEAYTITLSYPAGTMENPEVIEEGTYTASVEANSQGYFYTYTAPADGIVVVTMNSDKWTYGINNKTAGTYGDTHYSDDASPVSTAEVEVSAGDVLEIVIGTPDWSAADVEWKLELLAPGTDLGDIF